MPAELTEDKRSEVAVLIASARHRMTASLAQRRNPIFAERSIFVRAGFISKMEASLAAKEGVVLPPPIRVEDKIENFLDKDFVGWVTFLAGLKEMPVAIGMGVVDFFTGGHDRLVRHLLSFSQRAGAVPIFLLEGDTYAKSRKRATLFNEHQRAGWFNWFPTSFGRGPWVAVFPQDEIVNMAFELGASHARSWVEGFSFISMGLGRVEEKTRRVHIIMPSPSKGFSLPGRQLLEEREKQVREFGFTVVKFNSTVTDISSSEIRNRFGL